MARHLLFALAALGTALATAPPAAGQAYPAQAYEERDGLPSGVVYDIAQESNGRMWFTTRAGLVAFDGQEWAIEELIRSASIPLSRLEIDDSDRIWAATDRLRAGLWTRPHGGAWTLIPAPEGADGAEIVEMKAERTGAALGLIVATRHHGLFELWPDGWRASAPPGPMPTIIDLEVQGTRLLLATDQGLWIRAATTWRRVESDAPEGLICALAAAGQEEGDPVWLVGSDWLGLLEQERIEPALEQHAVFFSDVWLYSGETGAPSVVADGTRGLWFGDPLRLAHFDLASGTLRNQGVSTGLASGGTNALYRDLDDNVWVATHRGITRISSLRFTNYTRSCGFLADEVTAIVEHPPGRLVFGHPGGLSLLDLASGNISTAALPLSAGQAEATPVLDLAVDPLGNLWLAAAQLGLARLTPEGDLTIVGGGKGRAHAVYWDPRGQLLVGSNKGLFLLDGDDLVPHGTWREEFAVRRILASSEGRLSLCTIGNGAWIEGAEGWRPLKARTPGEALQVYAIRHDDRGRIWVGAMDGLFVEENGVLMPMSLGNQTMREPVYSISRDADGRYWFGTQLGVVSWDGSEARRYGVSQGLAGLETNRAANLLDSTGAMWFGTVEGASRYSKTDDRDTDRPPVVELLGMEVHGVLRPLDQDLELGSKMDDPVFRFRAISFQGDGIVEYRCRLGGFEDDWVSTAEIGSGQLRYTNVPGGSYRFTVQARNRDGRWGPVAQSGRIQIAPPFWLRGWFLTLEALVAGAIGLGFWRLGFERRKARLLEHQVEQRTAELLRSQKFESLGLLAGGVAHDFNNLLTAIMAHCELARLDAESAPSHLDSIELAAERGAALTTALLGYARRQEARPRVLSLNENIGEMQAILRALMSAEIRLRVELAPDLVRALLDPGQLEQVLMNLVVNAIDAMPAGGSLTIATENLRLAGALEIAHEETVPAGSWVRLSVSDTGIGMDEHTSARLFDPFFTTKTGGRGTGLGLSTCHGIVKQNGGFIDFATKPGRGTTFSVYFPASDFRVAAAERPAVLAASELDACVLVAEDDAMVRPILQRALEEAGCPVLVAGSAEEALRIAAGHAGPIDLLVSDVIMPGLSGPELYERLLQERPALRALFISGYTSDVLSGREHALSEVELLYKPFSVEELISRAAHVLASGPPADVPVSSRTAERSASRSRA